MRHMISPHHIGLTIVIDDDGGGMDSVDGCHADDATHIAIPVDEYDIAATPRAPAVLVTKADLRLLVALANTVEDIAEEEAAALNRARFRADPS